MLQPVYEISCKQVYALYFYISKKYETHDVTEVERKKNPAILCKNKEK